jgi:phosphoribosylformylglycinamidine (FGAM) synthase PurS component
MLIIGTLSPQGDTILTKLPRFTGRDDVRLGKIIGL